MLAANGAFKSTDWNYTGSPSNDCTTKTDDGRVWYLPETGIAGFGSGAQLGYNKKLQIPQKAVLLAAKWRSNTGDLQPRQADTALDNKLQRKVMPEKEVRYLLTAAWYAFGVRGQELNYNVSANMKQSYLEVGWAPYLEQSIYLIDGNENDPARGMFGFIPPTFDFWKVDGFNDIYNPLDNILAAVNAQVNAPHPILDGSSGWSVAEDPGSNPYTSGGSSQVISAAATNKPVKAHPYRGKPQTDQVSKAVGFLDSHNVSSPCYVAVVNDWYQAIKAHPPPQVLGDGSYVNPFAKGSWGLARTDMGVDYLPNKVEPVVAIGDAKILGSSLDSGWPSGGYIYYQLLNGDHKGDIIYVAEHLSDNISATTNGQPTVVRAGQQIALAHPGYAWTEWGWANADSSTRASPCYYEGEQTASGKAFARFLRSLGAKTLYDPGPGPDGPEGPLC